MQKIKLPIWLLVLCLAALSLSWQTAHLKTRTIKDYDQLLYLPIAHDLATTGIFTDGRFTDLTQNNAGRAGMFIAPLYPALIAGLSKMDTRLAATLVCSATKSDPAIAECPLDLGILRPVQLIFAMVTLLLLWQTVFFITSSPVAAWSGLFIACLLCRDYAEFANVAMTEAIVLPLFAAFSWSLIKTIQQQKLSLAAITGLLLGFSSLARPEYIYLADGFVALTLLAFICRRPNYAKLAAIIGLTGLLVTAPWLLRNWLLFHTAAMTESYAGFNLAQRVTYEMMTWREWCAGWLFYLPDFGDRLAHWLFNPADFTRLDYDGRPDTFYQIGFKITAPESLAAAGGAAHQVGYLLRHYALPDPVKYLAVTLLLSWRGLWIGKYFSLLTAPFLLWFGVRSINRKDAAALALLIPPLLLLGLHGAVSNNMPRYNLILVPALATAIGALLGPWLQKLWQNRRNRSKLTP